MPACVHADPSMHACMLASKYVASMHGRTHADTATLRIDACGKRVPTSKHWASTHVVHAHCYQNSGH
eukprot:366205-Chlamydomonas_euryale.AAC.13